MIGRRDSCGNGAGRAYQFRRLIVTGVCGSLLLLSSLTPEGFAQESKPTGDGTAKPGDPVAPSPADWERLIYLPYKNLKQVFDKEGAAVFMPYGQFLKMWDKLRPMDLKEPQKPPVNAVITEAAYVGKIEQDVARIDASLTIQVLGKPWVELPIQFGDAAIGKMTASDDKILLQGTGNGTYALLFPKAGEHKVKLELSAKVRTSPDGRSLELDCPASGITSFELKIPSGDQAVEITPQAVVTPAEADATTTRVKASLGATNKIAARWRPRVSTAPVMEVLTSVQNALDVRVADGLVHTHATLTYQVLRGNLDQIRIAVPLDHRILDVTAAGMKAWKSAKDEKSQVITVDLLGGESRTISVEVHTERPAPAEAFDLAGVTEEGVYHGIHALGEVRENGLIVVSQSADLSLAVEQQMGLARVEAAEVPEPLRRPGSLFYKFYTPRFRLQVAARPVEPRLLAVHRTRLVFRDDELLLVSQLTYTVERAGVFELRYKLPENLKIDRVDCEPMKEFQAPDGTGELIIALREKTIGQIAVTITGHLPFDPAQTESQPLPLIEPLALAREEGTIVVYAPESLEIIADEKGVQGAQPARPDQNQEPQIANSRLVSVWTYNRRPEIPVRTERKPTRLTAAVATTINVKQGDTTEVISQLNYLIQFAGIDTFRFAVPEAVAASVQIESVDAANTPIKQKSREEGADEGWVVWRVVTQREVSGKIPIRVRYDLKTADQDKSKSITVSPVRVLPTPGKLEGAAEIVPSVVSGEITVQKDRSLSVSAKTEELEAIDVRELTLLPQEGYLAYRYFKQPDKLTTPFVLELVAQRHEIQEVVETVVGQALVEAVVTEDKSITYRCRYRLKTSERQRLAIELPMDVEILDTLVAGKRVDLEKTEVAAGGSKDHVGYRVNVTRATTSDEPFVLALVFRAPYITPPLIGRGGNLKLQLPRLGGPGKEGHSAVAIQQLRTAIWIPKEFALVGKPADFTAERQPYLDFISGAVGYTSSTDELERWFGDTNSGLFAFTPAGRAYQYGRLGAADTIEVAYWRTNWFAWVISLAVAGIGAILAFTSWENRLTVVLLTAFGCAMYALKDVDLVVNTVAAARFGLCAVIGFWVIHALGRPRKRETPPINFRRSDPETAVAVLGAVIPPPGLFEKPPPKIPE